MSRTLYSPRLSDDVVRALYREGQRRRLPMTRLADELLRQSLDGLHGAASGLEALVREDVAPMPNKHPEQATDAA